MTGIGEIISQCSKFGAMCKKCDERAVFLAGVDCRWCNSKLQQLCFFCGLQYVCVCRKASLVFAARSAANSWNDAVWFVVDRMV